MRRLLKSLSSRLPVRIISEGDAVYLERYYVATAFGLRAYLHRFVASDPDRGLHDHPWKFAVSFILSGWYYEETRAGTARVNWINFLVGDSFHRVLITGESRECWTLFVHRAGRSKAWGFLRPYPDDDTLVWHRYAYPGGEQGEERRWWLTAPLGRDEPRRLA